MTEARVRPGRKALFTGVEKRLLANAVSPEDERDFDIDQLITALCSEDAGTRGRQISAGVHDEKIVELEGAINRTMERLSARCTSEIKATLALNEEQNRRIGSLQN